MRKLIKIILLLLPVALICAGFSYVRNYSHADASVDSFLRSDGVVNITKEDYGWFFDGPSTDKALIFYPGGRIEETAYAPLLNKLAAKGVDVFLVKMPVRIALLGINKADSILEEHEYERVYIGGHSLGGVAASIYASNKPQDIDGLVFLASYPAVEQGKDTDALMVYGTEDGVLNMESYTESKERIPADVYEYVIQGGNHAQFGSYGAQEGDGDALISGEEQVAQTVSAIVSFTSAKKD